MSVYPTIFEPVLTGSRATSDKRALDLTTPRGLFVGSKDNLYLVCDDPEFRFAVTIVHSTLPAFTFFRLGDLPVDNGAIVATGKVQFKSACIRANHDFEVGSMYVGDGYLSLRVRDLADKKWWQRVSYGAGGRVGWMSESWFLLDDDGEILFHNQEIEI